MLTRQVSLVRTRYRAPVASLRKTGSDNFAGAATTEGKQPPISHLRNRLRTIKRYLQALLTKSEIELKLSQCKIQ
jgi:hypothetical protein